MSALRVRVYDVRFGDAILVSVPDRVGRRTTIRHILIDVGNVLSGRGGDDAYFEPLRFQLLQEHGFAARIDHMAIYGQCQRCAGR